MQFLDSATLASASCKDSTKFWILRPAQAKTRWQAKSSPFLGPGYILPGNREDTSKNVCAPGGSWSQRGETWCRVHHTDSEANADKEKPVAFFRAPSRVTAISCAGDQICETARAALCCIWELRGLWRRFRAIGSDRGIKALDSIAK